jgi:hypothetical protein
MGLKKQALRYMEHLLHTLEEHSILNTDLFKSVVEKSMRVDFFFLLGYCYGMNHNYEMAKHFYEAIMNIYKAQPTQTLDMV